MNFKNSEIGFAVPAGWEDRCITAFSAPQRPGQKLAPNVLVTRETAPPGEELEDYANRLLVDFARQLDNFKLQRRRLRELGGAPAVEITFQWGPEFNIWQRQIIVAHNKQMFTLVSTSLTTDMGAAEQHFETIASTFRFS